MIREGICREILPLKKGWADNYEYAILKSQRNIRPKQDTVQKDKDHVWHPFTQHHSAKDHHHTNQKILIFFFMVWMKRKRSKRYVTSVRMMGMMC